MSAYRFMWLMIMFDMPTDTKKAKKKYRYLRTKLLKEGYIMMQFSIYIRSFHSYESALNGKKKIKDFIASNTVKGKIRIIVFTDKQFANMDIIVGTKSEEEKNAPKQLLLF
ncbi:CRISPR-associated endonuclease Cas2 [Arcobacter defluvii]|uniref:CRISPR-associated endoribonuclease Cas2 n=2 Tax=Arcobacter TaxID=28196 RepID=A0AAE7BGM3_9BACT|nr:CRISPR-associated endonuclease Cas2 [Arcobacter defluvii]QKF77372.1 CRISPR/Cas system-associated endoribonuclease Cas2, type II-C [Arcobacter defluvii]